MPTFTGTNANEIITPSQVSNTVTRDPAGSYPSAVFDIINAGGGNDTVSSGAGNDSVTLGEGDDRYIWNLGDENDVVDGGDGLDTAYVTGTHTSQTIDVYAQLEFAKVEMGGDIFSIRTVETIKITPLGGNDSIHIGSVAGTAVERIDVDLGGSVAGPGDGVRDNVVLNAGNGNDLIAVAQDGGGLKVTGLSAEIAIRGADGADVVWINGGGGSDRLDASAAPANGPTVLFSGGEGADTLIGGVGTDALNGDDDADTMSGGGGTDFLNGGAGNDTLSGGDGDDFASGDGGDDRIDGGRGDDGLYGGEGHDALRGGSGSDHLSGSFGNDVLKGGGGADQFIFAEVDLGTLGVDKIRDFKPGKDSIAFDPIAELGTKVNRGEFVIGKKAKDADDHLIYNEKTGLLSFDADGRGGDAAIAFAKIKKHLDLSHKDFDVLMS